MALTASATPRVQDDMYVHSPPHHSLAEPLSHSINEIGMDTDCLLRVVHRFNRINLYYEVKYFSESSFGGSSYRQNDILLFLNKLAAAQPMEDGKRTPVAGIIYCRAKQTCDDLAQWLRGKGVMAGSYHRYEPLVVSPFVSSD
jgi:superfamily II DNA helicase RecQ